ncbi:MAG: glycosyltransferase [Patescibacteria group bacterium]|nr:glycosyltransferase [Patescibacteria group bacterium]
MKIALVHEFLTQYGGAERVLDAFLEIWPKATIHTLIYDKAKMGKYYDQYKIKTSFLQKFPAPPPARYKWWLPLYPKAIESFDFSDYDLVFSDSSAFAKGVITKKPTKHICYMHTPTRYLWSVTKEYLRDAPIPSIVRPIMPPVINLLKKWDFKAAQRPEYLIANSKNVAERIKKFYHRSANEIIFPPVDTKKFTIKNIPRDYWLVVGRQEPYKCTDLAIAAANKLKFKLVVAGSGTKIEKFTKIAGPTVKFVGRVSDEKLAELYTGSIGLIFPPEEDAGITPLEAMASGRPVMAYNAGGARETVIPGLSGEFFDQQTVASLVAKIAKFDYNKYDPIKIRNHALSFDKEIFKDKIKTAVKKIMK